MVNTSIDASARRNAYSVLEPRDVLARGSTIGRYAMITHPATHIAVALTSRGNHTLRELPRTTEALVRDRVKFRVGRIVYLAFPHDETIMGYAFPRDEREALVRSEPHKFLIPDRADLRYQWVQGRLDAIDEDEMRELVLDAWRMVVPKRVAAERAARG
jgi:hypothetical protein